MPLILTEEQTMLAEAAGGFLAEQGPISHLRQLRDDRSAEGISRDLWRAFGDMGLAGVIITLLFFWFVGFGLVIGANLNAALAETPQPAVKGPASQG